MSGLDTRLATSMIRIARDRFAAAADRLSELDAVAGDGDHGANMATAFAAADTAISNDAPADVASVFQLVGDTFGETGSGSAGALFGVFFGGFARHLAESDAAAAEDVVAGFLVATDAVADLGGAARGDKTLLDALVPAVEAATGAARAGGTLARVLQAASEAAANAADATAAMTPRAGRARHAPQQSIGVRDPGAMSVAVLFEAFADAASDDTQDAARQSP